MITRIHLVEYIRFNNELIYAQVQLIFKGCNTYHVRVVNQHNNKIIMDKEFACLKFKGTGRKTYAKLRDIALNVAEKRDMDFNRSKLTN